MAETISRKRVTRLALAAHSLRQKGLKHLIIEKLWNTKIYRRVFLNERDLDEPIPPIAASLPIVIDLLKPEELDELATFYPWATQRELRGRLEAGHLCFVARHKGRIVHSSWVATNEFLIGELGLRCRLSPDMVFGYDMYTEPEFRNRHVASARLTWSMSYLRSVGYRRVMSSVMPENEPSRRAIRRAGIQTTGWLARIALGPVKVTLYKPIRNKHHKRVFRSRHQAERSAKSCGPANAKSA